MKDYKELPFQQNMLEWSVASLWHRVQYKQTSVPEINYNSFLEVIVIKCDLYDPKIS